MAQTKKATIIILIILLLAAVAANASAPATISEMDYNQAFKNFNKSKLPRGMRLNNPFNVMRSNFNPWKGKVWTNTDFLEEFVNINYGIRAGFINLRTMIRRGNDTIPKITKIYAPKDDGKNPHLKGNDPIAYAENISKITGISQDKKITLSDTNNIISIAYAIVGVEQGDYIPREYLATVYNEMVI